jgi:hypothetical protein
MQLWLKWLIVTAVGYVVCATAGLALTWLFVQFQPMPLFDPLPFAYTEFNPSMDRWRQIWNALQPLVVAGWLALTSYIVVQLQRLVVKPKAQSNEGLERMSFAMQVTGLFLGLFLLLAIAEVLTLAPAMTILVVAFVLGLIGGRIIDVSASRFVDGQGTNGTLPLAITRMLTWAVALSVYVMVYVALGGPTDVESHLRLDPLGEVIIILTAGGVAILLAEGIRGALLVRTQLLQDVY